MTPASYLAVGQITLVIGFSAALPGNPAQAVQAGALTDAIDRPLLEGHPDLADYARAAPFRAIAAEVGLSAAYLAHCYALSMDGVSTVVLGVKNREELRDCIAAEAAAPLDPALMARIEAAVAR